MVVSKSEFIDWKSQSVTKAFIDELIKLIQQAKDSWADGVYTMATIDETVQLNARNIGTVQTLQTLLDAIHDGDFIAFVEDEQNEL